MSHRLYFYKNAESNLVAIVTLIFLAIVSIGIFWTFVSNEINLSPKISCSDFELSNNIKILNACYLNENEILVSVERGLEGYEISSLQFNFDGFKFLLKDKSFGCSDVRELNSDYGRACEVISAGMKKDYVFNVAGEDISKNIFVGVYLKDSDDMCGDFQKEISANC